jgi:hypothetical protein
MGVLKGLVGANGSGLVDAVDVVETAVEGIAGVGLDSGGVMQATSALGTSNAQNHRQFMVIILVVAAG